MLAEVLHFYSLGWDGVLELEMPWFCKLYQRIPVIEARRLLGLLPALSYPHMATKEDRERLYRGLQRQAGLEQMQRYLHDPAQHTDGWAKLRGLGMPTPPQEA